MSANSQLNVQKSQKRHSSGKKKRRTQKAPVMADRKNSQIIATSFSHGNNHDFQLLKDEAREFPEYLYMLADASYQGLMELHKNKQTPIKRSKYHALTKREKQSNRGLTRKRIVNEYIFRKLKVVRILSERYRNRRKRFVLRFNLIAAIYNLELASI